MIGQKVVAPQDLLATNRSARLFVQSAVTMRRKVVANMHGRALTGADTDALIRFGVEAYEGADLHEGAGGLQQGRHRNSRLAP
ncbi:enoyl-CoA hydratase [Mycobacterium tuberculosis]